jgi:hypothetical protein
MDFTMPATFPEADFRAFLLAASRFFPDIFGDDALFDPQEKKRHFDWSWQAVRYRYRTCAECSDEFKPLFNNASEAGWEDEELEYKLERCIYLFFMSALSVFDSFGFCLYFLGGALRARDFPNVGTPRNITLAETRDSFAKVFPSEGISGTLRALLENPGFAAIKETRNVLAHRLSGRRSVRSSSTRNEDGILTTNSHKETFHIPGLPEKLEFDKDMLQRQMREITDMLSTLAAAAREFAESQ